MWCMKAALLIGTTVESFYSFEIGFDAQNDSNKCAFRASNRYSEP